MAGTADRRRNVTVGEATLPGGPVAKHAAGVSYADKATGGAPGARDMRVRAGESDDGGHAVERPQGTHAMATQRTIDRQTLTVEEAATLLGIGRNSAYQAIARGELPALRLGRRLLVPRAALDRHLAESGAVERDVPARRRA